MKATFVPVALLCLAVPATAALAGSAPALRTPGSEPAAMVGFPALAMPQLPDAGSALKSLMWLAHPQLPAWAERWLYNPRERTAAAIDALRHGDGKAAVADADSAARLAPESNLTSYNAGSARLATGDRKLAGEAAPLLEKAAKGAGRDLGRAASYNLGNARFATGEYAGAIEAYKQALRLAPADADAKFNLELAMQCQREQQNQRRAAGPRSGGGTPRAGDRQQTAGQGGPGNPGSNPQPGKPSTQPGNQQQAPQRQAQSGNAGAQGRPGPNGQPAPLNGQQPLPGYKDQPEMTANQAAAVLEAVQNLERQQRREAAAREARQRAAKGEDW